MLELFVDGATSTSSLALRPRLARSRKSRDSLSVRRRLGPARPSLCVKAFANDLDVEVQYGNALRAEELLEVDSFLEYANPDEEYADAGTVLGGLIKTCSSIEALDELITAKGAEMTPFHVSGLAATCERLLFTTLNKRSRKGVVAHGRLDRLLALVRVALPDMNDAGAIQVLSLLANLRRRPPDLVDAVLRRFHPFKLSNVHIRRQVHLLNTLSLMYRQCKTAQQGNVELVTAVLGGSLTHFVSSVSDLTAHEYTVVLKLLSAGTSVREVGTEAVLQALIARAEQLMPRFNCTHVVIVLHAFRDLGHVPTELYAAVELAMRTGQLGWVNARESVSLLWCYDTARQPLDAALQRSMFDNALRGIAQLKPIDVTRLALVSERIQGVAAADMVPVAEFLVRHAVTCTAGEVAKIVDGLLRCGCVHEGALAACRSLVVPQIPALKYLDLFAAARAAAGMGLSDALMAVAARADAMQLPLFRYLRVMAVVIRGLNANGDAAGTEAAIAAVAARLHTRPDPPRAQDGQASRRAQRHDEVAAEEANLWAMLELMSRIDLDGAREARTVITRRVTRDMTDGTCTLTTAVRMMYFILSSPDQPGASHPELDTTASQLGAAVNTAHLTDVVQLLASERFVPVDLDDGESVDVATGVQERVKDVVLEALLARVRAADVSDCVSLLSALVHARLVERMHISALVHCAAQRVVARGAADGDGNGDGEPALGFSAVSRVLWAFAKLDVWPDDCLDPLCRAAVRHLSGMPDAKIQEQVIDLSLLAWGLGARLQGGVSRTDDDDSSADDLFVDLDPEQNVRIRGMLARLSGRTVAREAFEACVRVIMTVSPDLVGLRVVSSVARSCAIAGCAPAGFGAWAFGPSTADLVQAASPRDGSPRSVAMLCRAAAALRAPQPVAFRTAVMHFVRRHAGAFQLNELSGVAFALSSAPWTPAAPGQRVVTAMCAALERELVLRLDLANVRAVVAIVVSLARMGHHVSRGVASSLSTFFAARCASMEAQDVLNLMWALGRCNYQERALLEHLVTLVQRYSDRQTWAELSASEQDSAVVIMTGLPWALATGNWQGKHASGAVLLCVEALTRTGGRDGLLPRVSPQRLTSMLWGLSKYRVPAKFTRAAFAELRDLDASDLSTMDWVNLVYAAACLNYQNRPLLRYAFGVLGEDGALRGLTTSRLTELVYAFGKLRLYDEKMLSTLAALFLKMLAAPEEHQVTMEVVSVFLWMFREHMYRETAVFNNVVDFCTVNPHMRFTSWGAMTTTLASFAALSCSPRRLLDHCLLSLPDLPLASSMERVEGLRQNVKGAWALAVSEAWDHPLMAQIMLNVASASSPRNPGRAVNVQLGQFLLLASAGGRMDIVAAVPDTLRERAIAAWRAEIASNCNSADDRGKLTVFESMVAATLMRLGIAFQTNVASDDGLMHWDIVLTLPLPSNAGGFTHVALELWNEGHVAANTRHPCAKVSIRTRLSRARKVQLLPVPYFDWMQLKTHDDRDMYLQTKLRSVGQLA